MSWTTPVIVEVCIGMEDHELRVRRHLIVSATLSGNAGV